MNRSAVLGLLLVSLVAGLLVVGSAGVGGVASPATEADASDPGVQQWGTVDLQANETAEEDNETVRHRRPDEQTEDEGDLGGWLSDRLGERLGGGALNISEGQYDRASDLVGDEFENRLDQYVEVTGNEEQGERLNQSRQRQEELATLLAEFEQTRAEYEQAIENGDEERARELARDLVELGEQIESVSVDLQDLLAEIDAEIDEDLSEAVDSINETNNEVSAVQDSVVAESLTETELTVETAMTTASFLEPLTVTGQLRTVEGDPIANQSIVLRFADKPVTAETNSSGAFTASFRPTELPTGEQSVSIRYDPMGGVPYLGSEDTVNVSIAQVEPTLDVTDAPETVGFGDNATLAGSLEVTDIAVHNVTLNVTLGDQQIGVLNVTNGTFDGNAEVPATVPDGDRTLAVRIPGTDRALAPVEDSRRVTVRETETDVSVDLTAVNGTLGGDGPATVRVNGTLETSVGIALAGEPVEVRAGDQTVETLTTDANGTYQATVTVPDGSDDEAVTITVAYGGSGNLAPSDGSRTLDLQPASGGTGSGLLVWGLLLAGVLVAAAGAGFLWVRRRDSGVVIEPEGDTETSSETPGRGGSATGDEATGSLLARASDQLGAGRPDRAVQDSYAAVRAHLEANLGMGGPYTHWEFYEVCRSADGDEHVEAEGTEDSLRSLTESFERAVYGVEEVSEETAQDVLAAARELCGVDEGQSGSGQPSDD